MAASVELQRPARETQDGIGLLNAITDNLAEHHRKIAKTRGPLISYIRSHCRPLTVSTTQRPAEKVATFAKPSAVTADGSLTATRSLGGPSPRRSEVG